MLTNRLLAVKQGSSAEARLALQASALLPLYKGDGL
jgi:hypothetical protein